MRQSGVGFFLLVETMFRRFIQQLILIGTDEVLGVGRVVALGGGDSVPALETSLASKGR